MGISVKYQQLFFYGKELKNDQTLADYNVQQGSAFHMKIKHHQQKIEPIKLQNKTKIVSSKTKKDNLVNKLSPSSGVKNTESHALVVDDKMKMNNFNQSQVEYLVKNHPVRMTAHSQSINPNLIPVEQNKKIESHYHQNIIKINGQKETKSQVKQTSQLQKVIAKIGHQEEKTKGKFVAEQNPIIAVPKSQSVKIIEYKKKNSLVLDAQGSTTIASIK